MLHFLSRLESPTPNSLQYVQILFVVKSQPLLYTKSNQSIMGKDECVMLELRHIKKDYPAGDGTVHALKGVSIQFRKNEFVAILGPSGCGKTTMLNIIGGLDQYTSGDLVINGRSTKDYKDRDWDGYRNHSVGFVFQSYNLIPHQTVLQNVELALTLSGVSKAERRKRAISALEAVGLGDQLRKKPSQMSGGQMQRVAIARALVNNPDIILADEPTGALDSETSVQVMDILKEVAKERLVVMVTHNPELAERYATRTIRMLDGELISDSNPLSDEEIRQSRQEDQAALSDAEKTRLPSMGWGTSFSLSLKNLIAKSGRTALTAFAGSIGIIGIALILALSTGVNDYINQVQEDTLASYPIVLEAETTDMSALMISMMGQRREESESHDLDKVYSSTVMYEMMDSMLNAQVSTNNLKDFKTYLENGSQIAQLSTIVYSYDFDFGIYTKDADGVIIKSDVREMMMNAMSAMYGGNYASAFSSSMSSSLDRFAVWEELLPGEDDQQLISDTVTDQYELLYGSWPTSYNEVILFVDSNNEISDLMLYALGLISSADMNDAMSSMAAGNAVESEVHSWTYEELCGIGFKLILPAEYYQKDLSTGTYVDMSATDAGMDYLYHSADVGTELTSVGVARPAEDTASGMVSEAIGYTSARTDYAIAETGKMDVVIEQMDDPAVDVLNGLPFATGEEEEPTDAQKQLAITGHLLTLSATEKASVYTDIMSQPSEAYISSVVEAQLAAMTRESIESMIVQKYASEMGVDADTVMGYIADMSDEELFSQMETAIASQAEIQYAQAVQAQLAAIPQDQLASMLDTLLEGDEATLGYLQMSPLTPEQYNYLYDGYMPATLSGSTYEDNLALLGYVDPESPSTISIYATTFADKDLIADLITAYNEGVAEADQIEYTDYVALLMSSITSIISGISYVLIAFVSISLVVSSIMIGVITLISVQERTKEIGILRAIGASKGNVSSMFNAETVMIGLASGVIGVGVSALLCIPINAIIFSLTDIADLQAYVPVNAGFILVAISVILSVFAGFIPSRSAAKKDPVIALRTE